MAFAGWWIDGNTGKGIHVAEHWMEVRTHPERFGMTSKEVDKILASAKGKFSMGDTSEEGQRHKLLSAAMRNGWVRVRGYREKYSIEMMGRCATKLAKAMKFLKTAGVHPNSEILVNDLATSFSQRFVDGMSDINRAIKQGKIPDSDAKRSLSDIIKGNDAPAGIPSDLSDKQQRVLLRQRIGQRIHVPDPSPDDDFLPERALARGLLKLFG